MTRQHYEDPTFAPYGVVASTEYPQAQFPQYLAHKLSDAVTPVFQTSNKALVRETAPTDGNRSSYQPVNHPTVSEVDLSAVGTLTPEKQEYLQDLFYVTRGVSPFIASDGIRRNSDVTHGLIAFKGDLSMALRPTHSSKSIDGSSTETDGRGNTIEEDDLDTFQAQLSNAAVGHIASFEEPERLRFAASESFSGGLTQAEAGTETFYRGSQNELLGAGDRYKPRYLMSYNDNAGATLVEHQNGDGFPGRTLTCTSPWPAGTIGTARYSYLESNGKYALYTANNGGGACLFDLETGTSIVVPFQLAAAMPTGVIPFNMGRDALPGFLVALSSQTGDAGSLEWVDATSPSKGTIVVHSFVSEAPTAIHSHNGYQAIVASAIGGDNVAVYELDFSHFGRQRTASGSSLKRVYSSQLFAGAIPGNFAIAGLFTYNGAAHGVIRGTDPSQNFQPAVVNLLEDTVLLSDADHTNSNLLAFNPHVSVCSAPDGIYFFMKGTIPGPGGPVATDLNLSACAPIEQDQPEDPTVIPGLFRFQAITATQNLVLGVAEGDFPLDGSPIDVSCIYGHLVLSLTDDVTDVAFVQPSLSKHKSYAPIRAARVNTERPYPVVQRLLDAAVPADTVTVNWSDSGGAAFASGSFSVPAIGNVVTQGVVDYVQRNDNIFGVELVGHSTSPAIRARLVPYTPATGLVAPENTNPPTLSLRTLPLDTSSFNDPVTGDEHVAWNVSLLNIQPQYLANKLERECASLLPQTLDFTQRLAAWDVGFNLLGTNQDFQVTESPTIYTQEQFIPAITMDAIELNAELTPANTVVKGHRFFDTSPGEYATHAIGSTLGLSTYSGNILGDTDILYLGCGSLPEFNLPSTPGNLPLQTRSPQILLPRTMAVRFTDTPGDGQTNPNANDASYQTDTGNTVNGDPVISIRNTGAYEGAIVPTHGDHYTAGYLELDSVAYIPSVDGPLSASDFEYHLVAGTLLGDSQFLGTQTCEIKWYYALRQGSRIYKGPLMHNCGRDHTASDADFFLNSTDLAAAPTSDPAWNSTPNGTRTVTKPNDANQFAEYYDIDARADVGGFSGNSASNPDWSENGDPIFFGIIAETEYFISREAISVPTDYEPEENSFVFGSFSVTMNGAKNLHVVAITPVVPFSATDTGTGSVTAIDSTTGALFPNYERYREMARTFFDDGGASFLPQVDYNALEANFAALNIRPYAILGDEITVRATADPGSAFSGWNEQFRACEFGGGGSNVDCSLEFDNDGSTVRASFESI
jgi:hypothetical protein